MENQTKRKSLVRLSIVGGEERNGAGYNAMEEERIGRDLPLGNTTSR